MSTNGGFSKKILKILGEKPAISLPELVERVHPQKAEKSATAAISRSLKGLRDTGLIEETFSGQNSYARLTKEGKKKAHSLKLDNDTTLVDPTWDGKWRIVLLDLPETRKDEREALRYLLKKAGFVCLKNSVWISPFPYEHLFTNIKKDFGLTTELMIFVTDNLDPETKQAFFDLVK
jgi:phenylacetic acid degradation operon negative regulatory protein